MYVTVQTSGVELAEGLLMTAGLSVNSRYEPKNSRRSDTQIPSSLNSYRCTGVTIKHGHTHEANWSLLHRREPPSAALPAAP